MDADCCEWLAWDSAHFGRRIARVRQSRLDEGTAWRILDWCAREDIDCLYFLADADDEATARIATAHGFDFQDLRVAYERRVDAETRPSPSVLRGEGSPRCR